MAIKITEGNKDDRKAFEEMAIKKDLKGKAYADKGYISKDLFSKLYSRGLLLITGIKRNMKNYLMKETEDYSHTRYSIIASSVDNILKVDQNFNELLLFISLIDSQDIPRSLLDKHKNNLVTENFIYTLKKYSLITNESSSITDSTFSLHRATQAVILNYIISKLDLKNNSQFLTKITHTFENYLQELMDNESVMKIRAIQQHSNAFLSHKDIIDDQSMGIISAQLGLISYYTNCNNLITKQLLEDSLNSLKSISHTNELRIARVSTYLGNTYRRLADYQKAELLLTHSLDSRP